MTEDDLAFADATELGRLIARRVISSVELTNVYLARLERYGDAYGAVVTIMHERARGEAKRADRALARGRSAGPLHGVPYGVKDLLAAKGAPTTWGAAPFRDRHIDEDATVVKRLGAAGAVLLGKLAMVEFAGGFGYGDADASFTGPGRTPWNRAFWSGGSSTGSGAAVAAGLAGFAIGSETSGSILYPATFCGVTGLRPTYGRVSRGGAMALCWTLDKLGPMARSARDTDLVLRTIAGADRGDPTCVERPFPRARARPRIGIVRGATAKTMPAVAANFRRSLAVLAEFCDLTPAVAFPRFPYDAAVRTIVAAEGAAALRDVIESGRTRELRSPDDRIGGYVSYATRAIDYIDAMRVRTRVIGALERAFGSFDAIVSPTLPTVACPVGVRFEDAYANFPGSVDMIAAGNLAGLPAIGLPNGFGSDGLPTGLALLGRPFGEATLAAIAKGIQRRTHFHLRRPALSEGS